MSPNSGSFGHEHWKRVFAERSGRRFGLDHLTEGAHDRDPEVRTFLGQALFCEQLGVEALLRRVGEARDPSVGRCLAGHAEEELAHVAMLANLLGDETPYVPVAPVRWTVRYLTRDRSLEEHAVVCLVGEAAGMAFYEMAAERLRNGRVAEVLWTIAKEERLHLEFTRDLLTAIVPGLGPRRIRQLRRARTTLVAALLIGHAIDHWRVFGPAAQVSTAQARRRVLSEIEGAFAGVPELFIPPAAG